MWRPQLTFSAYIGIAVAAFAMLGLSYLISGAVIRLCPHGENCEAIGQILFATGLVISAVIAGMIGLAVKSLVERWTAGRPG